MAGHMRDTKGQFKKGFHGMKPAGSSAGKKAKVKAQLKDRRVTTKTVFDTNVTTRTRDISPAGTLKNPATVTKDAGTLKKGDSVAAGTQLKLSKNQKARVDARTADLKAGREAKLAGAKVRPPATQKKPAPVVAPKKTASAAAMDRANEMQAKAENALAKHGEGSPEYRRAKSELDAAAKNFEVAKRHEVETAWERPAVEAQQAKNNLNNMSYGSMTPQQKIEAAVQMHGTGSKQHLAAIKKFGPKPAKAPKAKADDGKPKLADSTLLPKGHKDVLIGGEKAGYVYKNEIGAPIMSGRIRVGSKAPKGYNYSDANGRRGTANTQAEAVAKVQESHRRKKIADSAPAGQKDLALYRDDLEHAIAEQQKYPAGSGMASQAASRAEFARRRIQAEEQKLGMAKPNSQTKPLRDFKAEQAQISRMTPAQQAAIFASQDRARMYDPDED